ncbi:putative hydroxypyruvate reductase [bacterium BMS3Abin14]|nr:putative hydroxypyruvate reductase [bacterium BMS3Abin14]
MTEKRDLKDDAREIFLAGVSAADPEEAVLSALSLSGDTLRAGSGEFSLNPDGRVLVVGAGKAGAPMARAVEKVLGDRIAEGIVAVKYGHTMTLDLITLLEAGHPVPDEAGRAAAGKIAVLLEGTGEKDLVVCLLSGGGSALLPLPSPPVTLEEKMAATALLLDSGADIGEINTVRKHISVLKGGGLLRMAHPARVLTLILSDVVGDALDVIASGPTVPDPTFFIDAVGVLEKYRLTDRAPASVLARLREGAAGRVAETVKPHDPEISNVLNLLVATNSRAIQAAAARARNLGYNTSILSTTVTGDTRESANAHAAIAREIVMHGTPLASPACVLSGGETTVTIRGRGKGGRNQEFALAAAPGIEDLPGVVILSGGTDGTDGPTDAAGAIADGTTLSRAHSAGMDPFQYLDDNNSYRFFEALGDLLITGPTMTNVMDIHVILVKDG